MLADGARWIWEEQRKHLTHAAGVLDVFHAIEHVAATAKSLHGEGAGSVEREGIVDGCADPLVV